VSKKLYLHVFCVLLCLIVANQSETVDQRALSVQSKNSILQSASSVGKILVRNQADAEDPRPRGSAVVIRQDGIVVTNLHVISLNNSEDLFEEIYLSLISPTATSKSDGQSFRLRTLLINKERDLALLQAVSFLDGKPVPSSFIFPAIELGDSHGLQLLDEIFIIGFPEKGGSTITVNKGLMEGKDLLEDWIKTDARLIRGNSGGAAVNRDGKLIGIPSRVIADSQGIDKDGDGFPDVVRTYGAVGFLRPVHLVAEMLAKIPSEEALHPNAKYEKPRVVEHVQPVSVRGIVRKTYDGSPIAGARIGLVRLGAEDVTSETLLTWGGTRSDGNFEMKHSVPPGRYTIKAKAIGYEPFTLDIEIGEKQERILIELRPMP
jgi:S1-C subfamily serine protease